jgi:hypothetical protein
VFLVRSGYVVKRDSAYTHIRVNDRIVAGRSVFVLRFHPRPAAGIIPFFGPRLKNCELP